ncbi:MAG: serine/threonine-protein phosphatase [Ignavibacteriae bacterium]|nr:serine/threonine-protein phosphatase [Ignavibacteriota bacterium]NOG96985.1 serine/threonine-protein phosphatase [Ignavibacteriota bacterium]
MLLTDHNSVQRNLSALVDFSNLINSTLDIEFTLNNLLLTCFGKFHTTKGLVALTDGNNELKVIASKGFSDKVKNSFPKVNAAEIENCKELKKFLDEFNLPICREIKSSNKTIGVLILGERLVNRKFDNDDNEFINTLLSIAATAIDNSIGVKKLKTLNRELDSKVNQLSSLFDLSKEFSGILEIEMVGKLLVYSIIGQMLVSRYAVLTCDENSNCTILDSKFDYKLLDKALTEYSASQLTEVVKGKKLQEDFPSFSNLGVELLVPMIIKGKSKGIILLGPRISLQTYSRSDIEFVSSVGSLAIISIENAKLFKETVEKQRMEKDLELARNIQRNLLPNKIPKLKSFEIAAFNESARQVGGDYYDVIKLNDGKTLVAIADVSGKGVQAALMMANLQAFLKSISKQNIPLDEATNLINDLVSENTVMGNFITFFWAVLNEKEKKVTFVNAGHNPPLLIRNGEIKKMKKGGMILGVMETTIPYEATNIIVESDDTIILFTDGVTEAMNKLNQEYTDERFEELLKRNYSKSADELLKTIRHDVLEFTQNAEQSDDLTALVIKVL